ncbi:MAG: pilus assembly protein TadB [Deltaproteobacteria bacterium]|nr:MAG: pilus assembly protein TadB [Deltaproteobacteria bacterium]
MKTAVVLVVFCLIFLMLASVIILIAVLQRKARQKQLAGLFAEGYFTSSRKDTDSKTVRTTNISIFGHQLDLQRLELLLLSADINMSAEHFLTLTLGAGLLVFILSLTLAQQLAGSLLIMLSALALPLLFLFHRKKARDEALVSQLPEALELIVRALRVGQSVDNALKEVSRNCPDPLGREIRIIHEEIALGLPFVQALQNFELRFARLGDVKLMTTAFIIQRETGGSLTTVLSNLAALIRERDKLGRQVKALTAEGRSSALILGILPIFAAGSFWLLRPDYIHLLFTHPLGKKLLMLAIVMEITGFIVMYFMTRMDP